ncbi:TRAP transporter substrate-binding protein DctP [Salinisphaera aquimarina]|uniref:TRAP transporter substrate-binding protein DctP n=1 Tax=Salinisphaera aquimarina TaxID=2094031 RepID=A0ABV7EM88_9GAMM
MLFIACVTVPVASAAPVTLKLAHQWPQNKDDYVIAAGLKFADEVEKRSNGDIKIRFFPAQSLVKAKDTHVALRAGAVDLAIYPYIYAAGAIPEMNLTLLPGLWENHDDVYQFRNSAAWKDLEKKAEDYGFKTLAWIQIGGGFASGSKAILTPDDVGGMKVRAAGKFMEYALQQADASTVSMPSSDAYGAMQRSLLGGVLTSSSSLGAYRMYEVSDYYASPEDYGIYYTIEPIAISMRTWNQLTPDQQKILVAAGKSVEPMALAGAKKEDARVAKLFADNGVKVEKVSKDDWMKWRKLFRKTAFPKFEQDVPGGKALLEKAIESHQ